MNIWYISKYARPSIYGFATRHFFLAKELSKRGHKTSVITSDSQHKGNFPKFEKTYNYLELDETKSVFIKTKKFKSPNSINRILSWIDFEMKLLFMDKSRLQKPDVIIASSLSLFTAITGFLLSLRYNSKFVFEVRDIWPMTLVQVGNFSKSNVFVKVLSLIEKFGYKRSDILISTLPNFKQHVKTKVGRTQKIFCLPQGYDEDLMASSEELPASYKDKYIPDNKFIVCYAGAIGRSNALETLIESAKELKKNKKIHFLFVGDGELLDKFKSETMNLDNITFAPKVHKQQVQSILKYCDVMYDSVKKVELYKYGLSRNKWIDYMYAGKPMIISYSGYKSMVNEARCGNFVEAGNTKALVREIVRYSKMEDEHIQDMGNRGREWLLENRSYSKLASKLLKILKWN